MQLKFRACLGMLVLKIQPVWYFACYQTNPLKTGSKMET